MIRQKMALVIQALFVILLVTGAYVFAKFQGGMASWTIFYFLIPFAFYSLCILLYPAGRISVSRHLQSTLISTGEKTVVTLTVSRPDRFPLLYLLVREGESPGAVTDGRAARLAVPGFRKEISLQYELTGPGRGEHYFPPVCLEVADFFGWIRKRVTGMADGAASFLVLPETSSVNYAPIGSRHEQGTAASAFSLMKETSVATSVREYQPGDRVSWIHWKSFARTHNLMTKEFDNKRGEQAVLLLDGRGSETFEEQIRFAASILKEAAGRQDELAFATTDASSPVIRNIASSGALRTALTQLARMKPLAAEDRRTPNYAAVLQGAGAVIIISGHPDPSLLQPVLAAANMQPVHCFVIRGAAVAAVSDAEQIRTAKSLGVHVKFLSPGEFGQSFREVARS